MNKILFFLFIFTTSIGFSNGLYFEPISKNDNSVIQIIDEKMYINPDRIFYEDEKILIRTDDYRYLPIVFFEKDDIGFYTYKGEKCLEMIQDEDMKKEAMKKYEEFRDEEYRKNKETQVLQDAALFKSNAKMSLDFYNDYKISLKNAIICNENKNTVKIKGSHNDKNGKTEDIAKVSVEHKNDDFSIKGSGSVKKDNEGNVEKKIEVEAEYSF